jgi:hypothetical protein
MAAAAERQLTLDRAALAKEMARCENLAQEQAGRIGQVHKPAMLLSREPESWHSVHGMPGSSIHRWGVGHCMMITNAVR